jgi:hypothetical protein
VVKPGGKVDQGIKALYAAMQTKAAQYPKTAAALSKVGTAAKFVFKVMPAAFGALELYNLYANWDSNTTEQNIADTVMAGANIALLVAELPVALAFMGGQMAGDAIYSGLLGPIDDVFYQIEKMAKAKMVKEWQKKTEQESLQSVGTSLATQQKDGFKPAKTPKGEIVLEITKEDVEKALQDTELLAKIENDPKFEAFKKEIMKSMKSEGGKEKADLAEHYSLKLRKLLLAI